MSGFQLYETERQCWGLGWKLVESAVALSSRMGKEVCAQEVGVESVGKGVCGLQVVVQPAEVGDDVVQAEIEAARGSRKSPLGIEDQRLHPDERELETGYTQIQTTSSH
jgi:hypothetical protein